MLDSYMEYVVTFHVVKMGCWVNEKLYKENNNETRIEPIPSTRRTGHILRVSPRSIDIKTITLTSPSLGVHLQFFHPSISRPSWDAKCKHREGQRDQDREVIVREIINREERRWRSDVLVQAIFQKHIRATNSYENLPPKWFYCVYLQQILTFETSMFRDS